MSAELVRFTPKALVKIISARAAAPRYTQTRVAAMRRRHGLSAADYALWVGVAESTVRRWELGVTRPSPLAQRAIHRAAAFMDGSVDGTEPWL